MAHFLQAEWNRNWLFLVGFAVTGTIITKFSLRLTEEDAKNSPFVQRHKSHRSRLVPITTTTIRSLHILKLLTHPCVDEEEGPSIERASSHALTKRRPSPHPISGLTITKSPSSTVAPDLHHSPCSAVVVFPIAAEF